jgi:hypothetical protein
MTTDTLPVLNHFIDYAAEGEEPADLLLKELIPPQLSELNLPHAPKREAPIAQQTRPSVVRIPTKLYSPESA